MDDKIRDYYRLKEEIEMLTAKKDLLGNAIKKDMEKYPDGYTTKDGRYKVKIVPKTMIKYRDESAIIEYLNSKGLSDNYVIKKLDTTKLNKELKNRGLLYEAVKNNISESIIESLSVDRNDIGG